MGRGALVWCAGVGGVWCSIIATALLLAALVSPYWAVTTEPILLDDPHPYYPDMSFRLNHHAFTFDNQKLHQHQPLRSHGFLFHPETYPVNQQMYRPLDAYSMTTLPSQQQLESSNRDANSYFSAGEKADIEDQHQNFNYKEDYLQKFSSRSEQFPGYTNQGVFLQSSRRQLSRVKKQVGTREDHINQESLDQNESARTKSYVVVEDNSDIVYKGVNITEWINPFTRLNRHKSTDLNFSHRNLTKFAAWAPAVDGAAAASSYSSNPSFTTNINLKHNLEYEFPLPEPGRSIPLKRLDENLSPIFHQRLNAQLQNKELINNADEKTSNTHDSTLSQDPERYTTHGPHFYQPETRVRFRHKTQRPELWDRYRDGNSRLESQGPVNTDTQDQKLRYTGSYIESNSDSNIGSNAGRNTGSHTGRVQSAELYQDDYDSGERPRNDHKVSTVAFMLGLWSVCPTLNVSSINIMLLTPRCASVSYVTSRVSERDWGLPGPTPLTLTVVARIRISTPFLLTSCALLVSGTVLAVVGRCCQRQAALLATLLFTLAGLSTGVAVVWFLSVITEEFVATARQGTAWSSHYSFRYGWSLLSAAASAGASFLAALFTGHAHMANFAPWHQEKLSGSGDEQSTGRTMMMKCRSESHIGSGRSFTSDTIRTYLTNDSRRQLRSQSSSQGCFIGTTSSQSFNDSSSLVDLTKPSSNDTINEQDIQDNAIEVAPPSLHCSRHETPARSSQFPSAGTIPLCPEYVNAEEFQVTSADTSDIDTDHNTVYQNTIEALQRQTSLQVSSHRDTSSDNQVDGSLTLANDPSNYSDFNSTNSSPPVDDGDNLPSPPAVASTSMFVSRTLPRRLFSNSPGLPMTNSFNEQHLNHDDQDNGSLESSFTEVEPPDLFNSKKKPDRMNFSNTLPHGGKHVAVYSKRGNVRAATLTDGSAYHLTHV
ncbi:uncharacterized protein LOC125179008 [Hyalella azteca]|uniref:Uncharacterized protein LOC125179008 n=1 Tax=Hyalella azteca TaxID=294128 RepID=A0A979FTR1_HYAAZ|nr:uncharacterized protein LOC125179008 [Hyalella azteca]